MRSLSPIPTATSLDFLEGLGFRPFEILDAEVVFSPGQTSVAATLMFDEPLSDWATVVFPIEVAPKWKARRGISELTHFATAIGCVDLVDTAEVVGRRGAIRFSDSRPEWAALPAA